MGREIKFRYRIELEKGIEQFFYWTLEEIEKHIGLKNLQEKILSRDEYTGLKDKNGKEIYEGDILDCIYKFDGCKKHKLQVIYQDGAARFWLKNIGKCHQPNITKTMWDMTRSEIIGNIYEDKKLLEKKDG